MNMLDDVEFKIAKLAMGPDDMLVVRADKPLSAVTAKELTLQLERRLGDGRKVLVIDSSVDLAVLPKAESKRFPVAKS